ncbi:MAG: hypothetical protein EOM03_07670 [Clostridia bacterium]|nr:hypothetical protein [Clostridia bacterium]
MAELYLSVSGNDSNDGLSTGTAKKTWNGIAAIIATGDVVRVLPGTFTGSNNYINCSAAKYAAIKVLCEAGVIFSPGVDYPIINVSSSAPDILFRRLVGGTGRAFLLNASGLTLDTCQNTPLTYKGIDANNCPNLTIIGGKYACNNVGNKTSANAYFYGNTTAKIDRTLFGGGPTAAAFGLWVAGTAKIDADYITVLHALNHGLITTSSVVSTVNDSAIIGCSYVIGGAYPANSTNAGKLVLNRCQVTPVPYSGYTHNSNVTVNDCDFGKPRIKSYPRKAYVVPHIDDSANTAYAEEVEAVLAARGMKGGYYIEGANWDTANNPALRAMLQRGTMEICAHSWSHTDPLYTHALSVTFSGTGTPSITIADGLATFASTVEGEGFVVEVGANTTLQDIVDAKTASWTFAKPTADSQLTTKQYWTALASGLAYVSDAPLPATLDWDRGATGRHVVNEVARVKTLLESILGDLTDPQTGELYACRSFGAPHNTYSSEYATAIKTAGYTNYRADGRNALVSADMFKCNAVGTPTDSADAAGKYGGVAAMGGICMMLSHNETECTIEKWGQILDAIKQECGAAVVISSAGLCVDAAKDAGTYNESTGILTTTYAVNGTQENTASPFFGPFQDGLTAGPWSPFDSTMPALSLAPTCPGKLKSVQEWSKVASAREIGKL